MWNVESQTDISKAFSDALMKGAKGTSSVSFPRDRLVKAQSGSGT